MDPVLLATLLPQYQKKISTSSLSKLDRAHGSANPLYEANIFRFLDWRSTFFSFPAFVKTTEKLKEIYISPHHLKFVFVFIPTSMQLGVCCAFFNVSLQEVNTTQAQRRRGKSGVAFLLRFISFMESFQCVGWTILDEKEQESLQTIQSHLKSGLDSTPKLALALDSNTKVAGSERKQAEGAKKKLASLFFRSTSVFASLSDLLVLLELRGNEALRSVGDKHDKSKNPNQKREATILRFQKSLENTFREWKQWKAIQKSEVQKVQKWGREQRIYVEVNSSGNVWLWSWMDKIAFVGLSHSSNSSAFFQRLVLPEENALSAYPATNALFSHISLPPVFPKVRAVFIIGRVEGSKDLVEKFSFMKASESDFEFFSFDSPNDLLRFLRSPTMKTLETFNEWANSSISFFPSSPSSSSSIFEVDSGFRRQATTDSAQDSRSQMTSVRVLIFFTESNAWAFSQATLLHCALTVLFSRAVSTLMDQNNIKKNEQAEVERNSEFRRRSSAKISGSNPSAVSLPLSLTGQNYTQKNVSRATRKYDFVPLWIRVHLDSARVFSQKQFFATFFSFITHIKDVESMLVHERTKTFAQILSETKAKWKQEITPLPDNPDEQEEEMDETQEEKDFGSTKGLKETTKKKAKTTFEKATAYEDEDEDEDENEEGNEEENEEKDQKNPGTNIEESEQDDENPQEEGQENEENKEEESVPREEEEEEEGDQVSDRIPIAPDEEEHQAKARKSDHVPIAPDEEDKIKSNLFQDPDAFDPHLNAFPEEKEEEERMSKRKSSKKTSLFDDDLQPSQSSRSSEKFFSSPSLEKKGSTKESSRKTEKQEEENKDTYFEQPSSSRVSLPQKTKKQTETKTRKKSDGLQKENPKEKSSQEAKTLSEKSKKASLTVKSSKKETALLGQPSEATSSLSPLPSFQETPPSSEAAQFPLLTAEQIYTTYILETKAFLAPSISQEVGAGTDFLSGKTEQLFASYTFTIRCMISVVRYLNTKYKHYEKNHLQLQNAIETIAKSIHALSDTINSSSSTTSVSASSNQDLSNNIFLKQFPTYLPLVLLDYEIRKRMAILLEYKQSALAIKNEFLDKYGPAEVIDQCVAYSEARSMEASGFPSSLSQTTAAGSEQLDMFPSVAASMREKAERMKSRKQEQNQTSALEPSFGQPALDTILPSLTSSTSKPDEILRLRNHIHNFLEFKKSIKNLFEDPEFGLLSFSRQTQSTELSDFLARMLVAFSNNPDHCLEVPYNIILYSNEKKPSDDDSPSALLDVADRRKILQIISSVFFNIGILSTPMYYEFGRNPLSQQQRTPTSSLSHETDKTKNKKQKQKTSKKKGKLEEKKYIAEEEEEEEKEEKEKIQEEVMTLSSLDPSITMLKKEVWDYFAADFWLLVSKYKLWSKLESVIAFEDNVNNREWFQFVKYFSGKCFFVIWETQSPRKKQLDPFPSLADVRKFFPYRLFASGKKTWRVGEIEDLFYAQIDEFGIFAPMTTNDKETYKDALHSIIKRIMESNPRPSQIYEFIGILIATFIRQTLGNTTTSWKDVPDKAFYMKKAGEEFFKNREL